jgi:transposase, IS5 family
MHRQGSFSQAEYAGKKKQTRRDKFLAEMERVVPWARLVERLRPFYPKGERGRPPIGLERMLRLYFLQQWYGLADEALEDALYGSQALRGFAGIDLSVATVPDATTVLNFRHWLEEHDLTRALFDEVGAMLEERGLLVRQSLPRRRPGARLSMPRSSPRRLPPRTRARRVTRRCTRPRKAISGTSG